jgi:hypothetical protein
MIWKAEGNMEKAFGEGIDPEWMALILQAKQIGLTIDEVKSFLRGEPGRKERVSQ